MALKLRGIFYYKFDLSAKDRKEVVFLYAVLRQEAAETKQVYFVSNNHEHEFIGFAEQLLRI
jgi:hypothetical protein